MIKRDLRVFAEAGVLERFREVAPASAARLERYQELDDPCREPIWVLPDLGPDDGLPVGTTLVTEKLILPLAIGTDPGCGYAGWLLRGVRKHLGDAVLRKWVEQAVVPANPTEIAAVQTEVLFAEGEEGHRFSRKLQTACRERIQQHLGLLSPGNHFMEIHIVANPAPESGLSEEDALLIVHNGSMGMGALVQTYGLAVMGQQELEPEDLPFMGLDWNSVEGQLYLRWHRWAQEFAESNRAVLARHAIDALERECGGIDAQVLFDHMHSGIAVVAQGNGCYIRHQSGTQVLSQGAISFVAGRAGGPGVLVKALEELGGHKAGSISHGSGENPADQSEVPPMPGVVSNVDQETMSVQFGAFHDVNSALSTLERGGLVSAVAKTSPVAQVKNLE